jgi:three-Cys-motif partner protein
MSSALKIDEIGYWSEVKLAILEEYAKPYNQILLSSKLHPIYVDAFAGAGYHRAKGTDRIIEGSPKRALSVQPPFEFFYFIDMDSARTEALTQLTAGRPDVQVYHGDCNHILIKDVFPKIRYDQYQRALCILDPYAVNLDWRVIKAAADSKAIEIFLNFPVMDMNRNVFWHRYEDVSAASQERMTKFWGDDSWKRVAYQSVPGLFGEMQTRSPIDDVVQAFRERLRTTAGFKFVPQPMPMRNSNNASLYYLFFAAQKPTAEKIVKDIFTKYAHVGGE